jgi:ribosomal protein L22
MALPVVRKRFVLRKIRANAADTDGFDPALLASRTATVRAAWAGNGNRKTRARGGADIW